MPKMSITRLVDKDSKIAHLPLIILVAFTVLQNLSLNALPSTKYR